MQKLLKASGLSDGQGNLSAPKTDAFFMPIPKMPIPDIGSVKSV
ncbi:MAG TPA: hypothetical protein PKY86_06890 [Niabella sp.]|nr:hypothetical protein [Niabella sp.]HQW14898.1 hypothetical protein [Niabella sp.]HQX18477.1 hypothetical protein [Niabella sp.]HQX41475.1 hypothetical protein [Niabella sp.]HRB06004.1 hypothetical protein [Niabella sp.]